MFLFSGTPGILDTLEILKVSKKLIAVHLFLEWKKLPTRSRSRCLGFFLPERNKQKSTGDQLASETLSYIQTMMKSHGSPVCFASDNTG